MDNPLVRIPYGLGFNSHMELGHAFELAGADVEYILFNELIENPEKLSECQGLGLPGGFTMGDNLGAGQSIKNRMVASGLYDELNKKLKDKKYPVYSTCNSFQILAKSDLFPMEVGTKQNDSGKHETGFWDLKVKSKNDSFWLEELKECDEPLYAPISHGEGNVYVPNEALRFARENKIIALQYVDGYICDFFRSSKGKRYNPNGSTDDIAGFAWDGNLVLFPHLERLDYDYQRPDRYKVQKEKGTLKGLYEPSNAVFRAGVANMN